MPSPFLYFAGQRLSEAELVAACLDGHLVAVGDAFIPADAVETPALRAASLRPVLGSALAAVGLTAAWVHGAVAFSPVPHRAQRVSARRLHHIVDRRLEYHDRRLPPDDLQQIGGVWVTTPRRTLADLARRPDARHAEAVKAFLRCGLVDVDAVIGWLETAGPLPHKRTALALLRGLRDQPDVTR
jgi:hypothetical protein